jgi:hypothetical protein
MKPARSLMDLYRTETYHEINIKHKIKTNSSNTFSMCVRSIIAIELGKLLRHQTLDKKRTRETLTHRAYISTKATTVAEIRPRLVRVIADNYPNLGGTFYFSIV